MWLCGCCGTGVELRASSYKAGVLPLETHLQPILRWLFGGWGLLKYLLGLAFNCDPSHLSLGLWA
jgi:hypothetical protein